MNRPKNNGLVAVPGKEALGAGQVVSVQVDDAAVSLEQRSAAVVTEFVTDGVANDGPEGGGDDHPSHGQVSGAGVGGGDEEHRFARDGDADALDHDADGDGGIAVVRQEPLEESERGGPLEGRSAAGFRWARCPHCASEQPAATVRHRTSTSQSTRTIWNLSWRCRRRRDSWWAKRRPCPDARCGRAIVRSCPRRLRTDRRGP